MSLAAALASIPTDVDLTPGPRKRQKNGANRRPEQPQRCPDTIDWLEIPPDTGKRANTLPYLDRYYDPEDL